MGETKAKLLNIKNIMVNSRETLKRFDEVVHDIDKSIVKTQGYFICPEKFQQYKAADRGADTMFIEDTSGLTSQKDTVKNNIR